MTGFQQNAFQRTGFQIPLGTLTFPSPADVKAGVQYGPTGTEYTGTLQAKTGQVWLRRR